MKLKPLLPSLRERKRYLVYTVITTSALQMPFSHDAVTEAITTGYKQVYGELQLGQAGLQYFSEYYNQTQSAGIIRINHKQLPLLQTSLCYVTMINNEKVIIASKYVSGVLGKAREIMATIKNNHDNNTEV